MKQTLKPWITSVLAALAIASSALTVQAQQLSGRLTLTGSSTVAPLVSEIGKRFEKLHPAVRIDVQTGGSSRGITDAMRGTASIGMSSRALKPAEAEKVRQHIIARDGISMLVHASNPVSNLTDAQVLAIYKGDTKSWKDVGGRDAQITVINRAGGRAELEQFTEYFNVKAPDLRASIVSGENQHGIKSVAGDPNAIIYMSVGASERAVVGGETIKILRWNGIEASSKTVADGTLPMNRPLILVTRPDAPNPLADAFIAYARSKAVHDLVEQLSYVPIN
jgi:phosphate transport system substrate-binding protein